MALLLESDVLGYRLGAVPAIGIRLEPFMGLGSRVRGSIPRLATRTHAQSPFFGVGFLLCGVRKRTDYGELGLLVAIHLVTTQLCLNERKPKQRV